MNTFNCGTRKLVVLPRVFDSFHLVAEIYGAVAEFAVLKLIDLNARSGSNELPACAVLVFIDIVALNTIIPSLITIP